MNKLEIVYRHKQELFFWRNHYYIFIPVVTDIKSRYSETISFILDTGAFLTVINRNTAIEQGIADFPVKHKNYPLGGFVGGTTADLVEVPQMIIGDRTINDVIVAIPSIPTTQNLLGLNVLEHFKYYVDTTDEHIYFADNNNYKIGKDFRSGEIQAVI
jgi:hypothetical protein